MTLPVVVALVVFFALTVGAFVLGACRASRDAQAESRRHVEELQAWGYSDEEWDGLAAELERSTIEPEDAA